MRARAAAEATHGRTINPPLDRKVKLSSEPGALIFPSDGRCTFRDEADRTRRIDVADGEGAVLLRRCVAVILLVAALSACGGGGKTEDDPLALEGEPSTPCTQAIMEGHNHEGAGEPTPVAFLPSIRECGSLAEWTAAAKAFGIDLRGREAQFVDNTCNATTTSAEVKASRICQEAEAELGDPRRIP